jgi:hypothetical protein
MSAGELAPCLGIIEATWSRNENQTSLFSNSGEADIIEVGDPFWSIDVRVNIKNRAHFDEWEAFLARRQLAVNTFTMWRTMRPNPKDKSITSDVGLSLQSYSVANSRLTFGGWGAGKAANYGDMLSYRTSANGYWIGQVVAPATADGSGNITVDVWPRPWAPHATTILPRRIQAVGEFRMLKTPRIKEGFKDWNIRFEAEQVLR